MQVYEVAEEKNIEEEKRKFEGIRTNQADKEVRSILYLKEKQPRVKICQY